MPSRVQAAGSAGPCIDAFIRSCVGQRSTCQRDGCDSTIVANDSPGPRRLPGRPTVCPFHLEATGASNLATASDSCVPMTCRSVVQATQTELGAANTPRRVAEETNMAAVKSHSQSPVLAVRRRRSGDAQGQLNAALPTLRTSEPASRPTTRMPSYGYLLGTAKKKAPGVAAKCLIQLPNLVGAIGLEPTTPTMSRWCSNQLSYAPAKP